MTEYSYELKIPKDRIAVLIGKKGEIKKELEETTKTRIMIDSKEGDITVTGEDPLTLLSTRDIIRAIARGVNPDIARSLLKPDNVFELIDLKEYVKNKNQMPRIKGRVIGKEGKARAHIEELTETYICVYGKTISIIGLAEHVSMAKRAIESLLTGSPHANVYKWLEKTRRDMRMKEII